MSGPNVATLFPENDQPDENDMVKITSKEYTRLRRRDLELQLLEEAGVDNWIGYSEVDWPRLGDFDDNNKEIE